MVGTERSEIAEYRDEQMIGRVVSVYVVRRQWDPSNVTDVHPWSKSMGDDLKLDR